MEKTRKRLDFDKKLKNYKDKKERVDLVKRDYWLSFLKNHKYELGIEEILKKIENKEISLDILRKRSGTSEEEFKEVANFENEFRRRRGRKELSAAMKKARERLAVFEKTRNVNFFF